MLIHFFMRSLVHINNCVFIIIQISTIILRQFDFIYLHWSCITNSKNQFILDSSSMSIPTIAATCFASIAFIFIYGVSTGFSYLLKRSLLLVFLSACITYIIFIELKIQPTNTPFHIKEINRILFISKTPWILGTLFWLHEFIRYITRIV